MRMHNHRRYFQNSGQFNRDFESFSIEQNKFMKLHLSVVLGWNDRVNVMLTTSVSGCAFTDCFFRFNHSTTRWLEEIVIPNPDPFLTEQEERNVAENPEFEIGDRVYSPDGHEARIVKVARSIILHLTTISKLWSFSVSGIQLFAVWNDWEDPMPIPRRFSGSLFSATPRPVWFRFRWSNGGWAFKNVFYDSMVLHGPIMTLWDRHFKSRV